MSRVQLLKLVKAVLGHFKFGEFRTNVMPCLPDLTWQTVIHDMKKRKVPLNMSNIRLFIIKNLEESEVHSLRSIYLQLSVVDVALHSSRRQWNAYKRLTPERRNININNLCDDIRQKCRLQSIECEVQSFKANEIIWISIIEKYLKKRGGVVWKPPIHCAFFMDTNYIFITGSVKEGVLKALSQSMPCNSIKKLPLSGHDVKSLFSFLKKKESGISGDLEYIQQKPRVTSYGIDYTQHKSRSDFAESCFNDDTIKLETMTFLSSEGTCKVPAYESLKMRDSLKLLSANPFSSFKKMIQASVIDPNNCDNIKYLMHTGNNIIKLGNAED